MKRGLFNGLLGLIGRGEGARTGDLAALAEALLSGRGVVSGVAIARTLFDGYETLPPEKRLAFLKVLALQFGADPVRLERAIANYRSRPGPKTALALHVAAEARRQELFRRLNRAPGGTHDLVRMREDVLRDLAAHPDLEVLDADFVHLFSSWFDPGFLVLRRIDWSTPARILEKVIRYEAVHAIKSWHHFRTFSAEACCRGAEARDSLAQDLRHPLSGAGIRRMAPAGAGIPVVGVPDGGRPRPPPRAGRSRRRRPGGRAPAPQDPSHSRRCALPAAREGHVRPTRSPASTSGTAHGSRG